MFFVTVFFFFFFDITISAQIGRYRDVTVPPGNLPLLPPSIPLSLACRYVFMSTSLQQDDYSLHCMERKEENINAYVSKTCFPEIHSRISFGYPYLKGCEAGWYLAGDSPLEQIIVRWNKINSIREVTNNVCLKIIHTANGIFYWFYYT